jgi:hypothetical protein
MRLPEHVSRRIAETIAQGGGLGVDEEARGHDAIALMGSLGALWMLRADGTFWDVDADADKPLQPLPEALHTTALVAGAQRHPWLAELLPMKPPGARECETCGGRGMLSASRIFCPHCDALGWKVGSSRR